MNLYEKKEKKTYEANEKHNFIFIFLWKISFFYYELVSSFVTGPLNIAYTEHLPESQRKTLIVFSLLLETFTLYLKRRDLNRKKCANFTFVEYIWLYILNIRFNHQSFHFFFYCAHNMIKNLKLTSAKRFSSISLFFHQMNFKIYIDPALFPTISSIEENHSSFHLNFNRNKIFSTKFIWIRNICIKNLYLDRFIHTIQSIYLKCEIMP